MQRHQCHDHDKNDSPLSEKHKDHPKAGQWGLLAAVPSRAQGELMELRRWHSEDALSTTEGTKKTPGGGGGT